MGPGMEIIVFDSLTIWGRRWYLRIQDAGNHEPLLHGEGYNSAAARDKTAKRFASVMDARIIHGKRK